MMQAPVETRLVSFNTLALHYQDEVFTLAYYLLGDEAGAAEVAQTAFESVYRRTERMNLDGFRFEILSDVLAKSRQGIKLYAARKKQKDELSSSLMVLPREEREAAVLVDVLGLSYDEAGRVLGCTRKQIARLVAQARFRLSQSVTAH